MSLGLYKKIVFVFFTALIIWAILSLWGYIPYLNGGSKDDRFSLAASFFIEVLSVLVLFFSPKGSFRISGMGATVLIWLLYTVIIVLATSDNYLIELSSVIWWPSIFILSCFVFRSKYSEYGFMMFRDYFIPVSFILNTIFFLYLRIHFSRGGYFFVSNQVFYVSLLLPSLFMLKKRWMKYLGIIITVICAMISFKRSTLIITLIALFFSVIFEMRRKRSFITSLLIIGLLVGVSYFVYTYVNNRTDNYMIERLNDMEETGGSGRLDIYRTVLKRYSTSNTFDKIIGIGYNSIFKNSWAEDNGVFVSAHNDFLEILVDFGIVGFLLYLVFVFQVVKNAFRSKKCPMLFQANLILLVVFFVMSSVSHLYLYPTYFAYLVVLIVLTRVSIERQFSNLEVK